MHDINTPTLLTDDLERRLIAQALAEEMRLQPIKAIRRWLHKVFRN